MGKRKKVIPKELLWDAAMGEKASPEELLCDAAMRGSTPLLYYIIDREGYHIFDKVLVGTFKGKNPLHVAILAGKTSFVLELFRLQPDLVDVVDTDLRTALHVACKSAVADIEIVKLFLEIKPEMCIARDRDGNNPLHIAAMHGKVELLEELVRISPQAARVKVDRGDYILHLCVNYNQLGSLQLLLNMIGDPDFVNSVDANGNNILHLAVFGRRFETIKYVLGNSVIDVNARNGCGLTAMDIYLLLTNREDTSPVDEIEDFLCKFGAKRRRQLFLPVEPPWQKKKKETLMIVSSLIAAMAFQVGLNPPGGCWQDTSTEHVAGKAINAYYYPYSYGFLMYFNTVGFLLSLTTILLLITALPAEKKVFGWIRSMISWMTIMTTALAYTFAVVVISPKVKQETLILAVLVTVIVWAVVISLFVQVETVRSIRGYLQERTRQNAAMERIAKDSEAIQERGSLNNNQLSLKID